MIYVDPTQLSQVLMNLLKNAIHAMPDGGALTIKTDNSTPNRFDIMIKDTGHGIPLKVKEKIFEPLFSTKVTGTGLGLPVVKTLVEGHGGSIQVKSKKGVGTTFIVSLPRGNGVSEIEGLGD